MRNIWSCFNRRAGQVAGGMVMCGLILVAAGCTSLRQYRTDYSACDTTVHGADCRTNTIEQTQDYLLGLVEFDDQGWLWDRRQAV